MQIPIRILNRTKAARLEALQADFTDCVRFHLDRADAIGTTNSTALHHDCYRAARQRFRLPAATLQQAREKAIQARKSYLQRKKRDRRARPPHFRKPVPLRLGADNLRIFVDRGMIRITTPEGFLWLPILVPLCFRAEAQQPHRISEVVRKGSRWFLMLAIHREDVPAVDGGPHFGLDLGIANTAVLSGPGVVRFWDGKPLRSTRSRYFRYRQALQKKRKTGMIRRSKGKERRWATNLNHQISREIVDLVAAHGGTLHVERLKGIRERVKATRKVNRMLHAWPFGQLLEFIKYKAAMAGVPVVEEDPRHSSQRCSRCGHTERGNRPRQDRFACRRCGYTVHADLNAARNLAARGACSPGAGDATAPLSGESKMARKGRPRDNRNLASSS